MPVCLYPPPTDIYYMLRGLQYILILTNVLSLPLTRADDPQLFAEVAVVAAVVAAVAEAGEVFSSLK